MFMRVATARMITQRIIGRDILTSAGPTPSHLQSPVHLSKAKTKAKATGYGNRPRLGAMPMGRPWPMLPLLKSYTQSWGPERDIVRPGCHAQYKSTKRKMGRNAGPRAHDDEALQCYKAKPDMALSLQRDRATSFINTME
jgi:hypothetical protein